MRWLEIANLASMCFVSVMRFALWFMVIFLAVYAANMAAFYRQGQILLDRLP